VVASFARDWGPTIAGSIVAIVGVLAGLATALLTIRSQARARREDQAQQLEVARGDRQHDLQLRQVESENERRRRFEDETLSTAAELSGNLSAAHARLTFVRQDHVSKDLDDVEALLREARHQEGRLSLLLGDRVEPVVAAQVALGAFTYALGFAREAEELRVQERSDDSALRRVSKELERGGKALSKFYDSAHRAGITGAGTG
jgi:hypothetical protein